MRVCLLSRYFDFRNAGLGRVSLEIEKGLLEKGHTVRRVSTDGNSLYSYFYYTLCEIPFKMPRDVDVYHAVTPMEGIWLPKKRSIVTFHDLFQITNRDKLGSGLGRSKWKNFIGTNYFSLAVNVAKRCSKVVAVSNKTKQDLITYLKVPEEKITVIRSGIRPDLDVTRRRNGVKVLGYLGQLDRRKRVDVLIKAFRESSISSKLLIAGTGSDEVLLRSLAGSDPRICFLGRIPDNGLVNFYNSLDVFIFPTWLEGYGLPIIEAMACKRPVVVLADADIPGEIRKRCLVTWHLEILLASEKHLETRCASIDCEANYRWAKQHNWNNCIDQYLELYREIV